MSQPFRGVLSGQGACHALGATPSTVKLSQRRLVDEPELMVEQTDTHAEMEKYPEADHQEHMPATGETDDNMTAGRYIATRFSTLKPPMTKVANPISLLRMLNKQQWLFFSVAFIAWTWDGMS